MEAEGGTVVTGEAMEEVVEEAVVGVGVSIGGGEAMHRGDMEKFCTEPLG